MYILFVYILMPYKIGAIVFHLSVWIRCKFAFFSYISVSYHSHVHELNKSSPFWLVLGLLVNSLHKGRTVRDYDLEYMRLWFHGNWWRETSWRQWWYRYKTDLGQALFDEKFLNLQEKCTTSWNKIEDIIENCDNQNNDKKYLKKTAECELLVQTVP